MLMSVVKIFEFEAAHHLPYHTGKCKNLHGHTYKLEVEVTGLIGNDIGGLPDTGMVVDFSNLSSLVNEKIIARLDHMSLNDILFNPTAENMVEWIVRELQKEIHKIEAKVTKVRLWETSKSYCEVRLRGMQS